MDVTMAMLSRACRSFLPPGSDMLDSPAVVRIVRMLDGPDETQMHCGALYVLELDGRCILQYRDGADASGALRSIELTADAPAAEDVLQILQDRLVELQAWGDRVMRSAYDGDPLEATIEIASEALENPLAAFDLSIGTLCFAGIQADAGMHGSMWETITKMESPFDKCDDEMQRFFIRALDSASGPFVFDSSKTFNDAFNDDEFMICPVFNEEGLCALLGSTSIFTPFNACELALVSYLQYIFGGHRAWSQSRGTNAELAPKTLTALLGGKRVRKALLNRSLMGFGWRSDMPHRVLRFTVGVDASTLQVSEVLIKVRSCLPRSILIVWEGDCLCIAREEAFKDALDKGKLDALAQRIENPIGVSAPQSDLMELRLASLQAKEARMAVSADADAKAVTFDACYEQRLRERIETAADAHTFCDLRVLSAFESGSLDHEQLHTLRTYLECGRNASKAAEALFVHRNTMFYRIGRIEAVLGQTVEDLIGEVGFEMLYLTCVLSPSIQY